MELAGRWQCTRPNKPQELSLRVHDVHWQQDAEHLLPYLASVVTASVLPYMTISLNPRCDRKDAPCDPCLQWRVSRVVHCEIWEHCQSTSKIASLSTSESQSVVALISEPGYAHCHAM